MDFHTDVFSDERTLVPAVVALEHRHGGVHDVLQVPLHGGRVLVGDTLPDEAANVVIVAQGQAKRQQQQHKPHTFK